jgi:hypothetical protein
MNDGVGMGTDRLLPAIDRAFECARPAQMVRNPTHCDECAEHEATMQSVTPESVSLTQVGSPSWDPVCFITDEAYRHFMPGFARLALGRGDDYYLDQFLFHLESGRIEVLDLAQCGAISPLLDHLYETMSDEIEKNMDDKTLGRVMDLLDRRIATLRAATG